MNNTTFIYALIDPRNDYVKYIGKTNNINMRFNSHIWESTLQKRSKKISWIKSLRNKGLKPEIFIIDEVLTEEWVFWEKHYISLYRFYGFPLTNSTEGGEAGSLKKGRAVSKEIRDKISKSHLSRPKHLVQESIKKALYTKSLRADIIKENRLKRGKIIFSKETIEKIRHQKLNMSDEYRKKLSLALKGKKPSKETLIKLRESHLHQKNENLRVPVIQLTKDGHFIQEHVSVAEAARKVTGTVKSNPNIVKALKKGVIRYGYKWVYKGAVQMEVDDNKAKNKVIEQTNKSQQDSLNNQEPLL